MTILYLSRQWQRKNKTFTKDVSLERGLMSYSWIYGSGKHPSLFRSWPSIGWNKLYKTGAWKRASAGCPNLPSWQLSPLVISFTNLNSFLFSHCGPVSWKHDGSVMYALRSKLVSLLAQASVLVQAKDTTLLWNMSIFCKSRIRNGLWYKLRLRLQHCHRKFAKAPAHSINLYLPRPLGP